MTLHASKYNDAAGSEYFGTKGDAMTCWQEGLGKYSCYIGYDAVANVLSEAKLVSTSEHRLTRRHHFSRE